MAEWVSCCPSRTSSRQLQLLGAAARARGQLSERPWVTLRPSVARTDVNSQACLQEMARTPQVEG